MTEIPVVQVESQTSGRPIWAFALPPARPPITVNGGDISPNAVNGTELASMRHVTLCLFIVAISVGTIIAPNRCVAAPLPIGVLQSPVAAEAGPLSATLVAGGVAVPFTGVGFSGGLVSSVYTNDATNPFGPDKLTFIYELSNSSTSAQVLHRLTIAGFANSLVDVSFDLFTTEPINRSSFFLPSMGHYVKPRSADHSTADAIGFTFVEGFGRGGLRRGDHSHTLVVQTNATAFDAGNASVIGGQPCQRT
jgi:hypothetical protein